MSAELAEFGTDVAAGLWFPVLSGARRAVEAGSVDETGDPVGDRGRPAYRAAEDLQDAVVRCRDAEQETEERGLSANTQHRSPYN